MDAGSQGGTKIVVYGSLFQDVEHLACKVSTVGPILATFVDENAVACVMPARRPGTRAEPNAGAAPLEVSLNAVDYTGDNKTTVTFYREGPDLDAFDRGMTPAEALGLIEGYTFILDVRVPTGPVTGGTVSVIEGANFYEPQTTCKFQTTQSPGIIVNKFRLMCITPPMPAGFAAYEIIAGRVPKITEFGFQFHFHARVRDAHRAGRRLDARRRDCLRQREKLFARGGDWRDGRPRGHLLLLGRHVHRAGRVRQQRAGQVRDQRVRGGGRPRA